MKGPLLGASLFRSDAGSQGRLIRNAIDNLSCASNRFTAAGDCVSRVIDRLTVQNGTRELFIHHYAERFAIPQRNDMSDDDFRLSWWPLQSVTATVPSREIIRPAQLREDGALPRAKGDSMPRFYFHVEDGGSYPDLKGTELPDLTAARKEAVRFAAALLADHAEAFWNTGEWTMRVADDTNLSLFNLTFFAYDSPATRVSNDS